MCIIVNSQTGSAIPYIFSAVFRVLPHLELRADETVEVAMELENILRLDTHRQHWSKP